MTKTRRRTGDAAVYEAMQIVVQQGLRADDSVFTPGTPVWTAENFAALRQHFIEQPDLGKDSYLEKLKGQLHGAEDAVIQLMAELNYIHFLLPSTVTGKKKLEIITAILAFVEAPPEVPEAMRGALDHGFINPGTFYLTRRDIQLSFLIEFGQAWKGLSTAEQDEHLADPWSFKQFLFELSIRSAYAQREGFLHLIHTEAFEAIVSREHKQLIAKRFSSLLDDPDPDVDRQLGAIRAKLTPTYGAEFDFYDERVRPQWQGGGSGAWDQFVKWAQKFYEARTFDADERDYKFKAIEPLGKAKAALAEGGEWSSQVRSGFQNSHNNLTDWRVHDRFLTWLDADDASEAALAALWALGDIAPRIDAFLDLVPTSELGAVGAKLNIASYLLMAEDPIQYPVYKPQPFKRARDSPKCRRPRQQLHRARYTSPRWTSSTASSRRQRREAWFCAIGSTRSGSSGASRNTRPKARGPKRISWPSSAGGGARRPRTRAPSMSWPTPFT